MGTPLMGVPNARAKGSVKKLPQFATNIGLYLGTDAR